MAPCQALAPEGPDTRTLHLICYQLLTLDTALLQETLAQLELGADGTQRSFTAQEHILKHLSENSVAMRDRKPYEQRAIQNMATAAQRPPPEQPADVLDTISYVLQATKESWEGAQRSSPRTPFSREIEPLTTTTQQHFDRLTAIVYRLKRWLWT